MMKPLILVASGLALVLATPALASSDSYGSSGSYGPADGNSAAGYRDNDNDGYKYKKNKYKKYGKRRDDDDDDDNYSRRRSGNIKWMGARAARAKASRLGYKVRRVERDDGYYEIDAYDKRGRRVELYLHPTTGRLIRVKRKH